MTDGLNVSPERLSATGTSINSSLAPFDTMCGEIGLISGQVRTGVPSLYGSLNSFTWTWENEMDLVLQEVGALAGALVEIGSVYASVDRQIGEGLDP